MGVDTLVSKETRISVPMALGKHLFSFRTQQLSPVAAIILRERETSTVPNYKKAILIGWLFSFGHQGCVEGVRGPYSIEILARGIAEA